jgi:hypothetical protein
MTLSYIFSNKPDYVGGTPLSVTISEITNAPYIGDVGAFIFSTFIRVDSVFFLQDQMVTSAGLVETQPGLVSKTSEITVSST